MKFKKGEGWDANGAGWACFWARGERKVDWDLMERKTKGSTNVTLQGFWSSFARQTRAKRAHPLRRRRGYTRLPFSKGWGIGALPSTENEIDLAGCVKERKAKTWGSKQRRGSGRGRRRHSTGNFAFGLIAGSAKDLRGTDPRKKYGNLLGGGPLRGLGSEIELGNSGVYPHWEACKKEGGVVSSP